MILYEPNEDIPTFGFGIGIPIPFFPQATFSLIAIRNPMYCYSIIV